MCELVAANELFKYYASYSSCKYVVHSLYIDSIHSLDSYSGYSPPDVEDLIKGYSL